MATTTIPTGIILVQFGADEEAPKMDAPEGAPMKKMPGKTPLHAIETRSAKGGIWVLLQGTQHGFPLAELERRNALSLDDVFLVRGNRSL